MGHQPSALDVMREAIAGSAYAKGMTDHLAALPEPALRHYLDEWLPAAVAAGGLGPGELTTDLLEMTTAVMREQLRFNKRGAPVADLRMDCRVVFVRVPETAPVVELLTPYSRASALWNRLERNPLDHVCYQVAELDGALAERKQAGARLVFGPVEAAAQRRRVAFVLDGDGLLTELVEHDRERPWPV